LKPIGQFGRYQRRNGEKIYINLKKQSQFLKGQNDANSVMIMVYGDFGGWRQQKNKANSKPNAGLRPETLNTKL
jgi:hypothetical protein